jgi:hypothetical protein
MITMKLPILTASLVLAAVTLSAQPATSSIRTMIASEPRALGAWSASTYDPIHGLVLRGRLVYTKDALENLVIFLELQNISSVLDTTYLYYDATNLTCELRDSSGKPVRSAAAAVYDGPVPKIGWLALPYDSILRFRVSLPGFGQATNLVSAAWGAWLLPTGETRDYYLSGELTLKAPTGETRPRVWQGTLKLPSVKIPADRVYPRPTTRSVAEFTFIGRSTTVEAAMARLGPPDANACVSSGYHNVLIYILADGTSIAIDTDGGARILRVQHGQTVLFEQAR